MDPVDRFAELMGDDYAEGVAYIAVVGRKAKERIEGLDLPAEGYGIVGGDYHGGNNYFAGRRVWRLGTRALESAYMGDQVYHDYGDYWGFSMDAMRKWDEEMSR